MSTGLWGLSEIVRLNVGQLNLVSGTAALYFDGSNTKTFQRLPSNRQHPGTAVDFQIHTDRSIDVTTALGGGKYKHVSLRMEAMENDKGEHEIIVQNVAHGTGTRRSAAAVRNLVLNTFEEGAHRVVLDFSGIGMISSSFADELVGKLVAQFGFTAFCQKILLRQINPTIQALINHSVAQRISISAVDNQSTQETESG